MPTHYQPPNQWQSPSQPYQPGYWPITPEYGSSSLVTIAGVVLLILGALFTLGGVGFVLVASAGSAFVESLDPSFEDVGAAAAGVLMAMAIFILVIGVIEIVTSVGLFIHKGWARWTGIVISVIGIILGLLMVMFAYEPPADTGFAGFALVWTAAHAFVAAALAAGRVHFERGYARR